MKFIVLEGLDGSGKSTQVKLLQDYFKKNKRKFKYLHFPKNEEGVFGEMVSMFLRGEFGNIDQVHPYIVALLFAGDREHSKNTISDWLSQEYYVLVDRYVLSNIAFQTAKLDSMEEKKKLTNWIFHLEYKYFKIPKPDIEIFLDVPFSFTKKSLENSRDGDDRTYLKGKADIHEASLNFQEKVRQEYLRCYGYSDKYFKINCSDENGNMLNSEKISNNIIELLVKENIFN